MGYFKTMRVSLLSNHCNMMYICPIPYGGTFKLHTRKIYCAKEYYRTEEIYCAKIIIIAQPIPILLAHREKIKRKKQREYKREI